MLRLAWFVAHMVATFPSILTALLVWEMEKEKTEKKRYERRFHKARGVVKRRLPPSKHIEYNQL